MLKIYGQQGYVSIDNDKWYPVGSSNYVVKGGASNDVIIFNNITFQECCEYLKNNYVAGLCLREVVFTHKPIIYADYGIYSQSSYTKFDTISYKYVYTECNNLSLLDILGKLPADDCVRYFKELFSSDTKEV